MRGKKAEDLDLDYVLAEYKRGRSLRDIAVEVKYSHVHLWRALKERGEIIRERKTGQLANDKVRELKSQRKTIQKAHAVILYSYGASVEEIAVSLSKSATWVRVEIAKAGLI